jgi:ectoine hydroxylase-related dioxygenase (phytanoyl-CoA dioxygenase family)
MHLDGDLKQKFDEDGVVCVRSAFSNEWVELLVEAVERRAGLGVDATDVVDVSKTEGGTGKFLMGRGLRFRDSSFAQFLRESGIVHLARQFLGDTTRVNLTDDQFFAKAQDTSLVTPWHQDKSFWPFEGTFLSIWVALDEISEESGSLRFVRGSHQWGKTFVADGIQYDSSMHDPNHQAIPDIDGSPGEYDVLTYELTPGDAAVFDARTLHSSPPNRSGRPRRAYSSRWGADDAVYAPRPHASPRHTANAESVGLVPGAPLTSEAFPVAWSLEDGQLASFLTGPIPGGTPAEVRR